MRPLYFSSFKITREIEVVEKSDLNFIQIITPLVEGVSRDDTFLSTQFGSVSAFSMEI